MGSTPLKFLHITIFLNYPFILITLSRVNSDQSQSQGPHPGQSQTSGWLNSSSWSTNSSSSIIHKILELRSFSLSLSRTHHVSSYIVGTFTPNSPSSPWTQRVLLHISRDTCFNLTEFILELVEFLIFKSIITSILLSPFLDSTRLLRNRKRLGNHEPTRRVPQGQILSSRFQLGLLLPKHRSDLLGSI